MKFSSLLQILILLLIVRLNILVHAKYTSSRNFLSGNNNFIAIRIMNNNRTPHVNGIKGLMFRNKLFIVFYYNAYLLMINGRFLLYLFCVLILNFLMVTIVRFFYFFLFKIQALNVVQT